MKKRRKPRFGLWRLGIHYSHYPLMVKKVVIRYPENWYNIEDLINIIEKLIENGKKKGIKIE